VHLHAVVLLVFRLVVGVDGVCLIGADLQEIGALWVSLNDSNDV